MPRSRRRAAAWSYMRGIKNPSHRVDPWPEAGIRNGGEIQLNHQISRKFHWCQPRASTGLWRPA